MSPFLVLSFSTLSLGSDFFDSSNSRTKNFGNAVETNRALQTVDPWSRHSKRTTIEFDASRILDATDNLAKRHQKSGQTSGNSSQQGKSSSAKNTEGGVGSSSNSGPVDASR
ncbi:MAG: hypothetical protein AAF228_08840 [Pseudomonadota bacterium]